MEESSRKIPEPIRRQLRQEAGFGCCICGNPVFQYHHIADWALTKAHNPVDMMALCPNHHHEETVHAIAEQEQRNWKKHPLNIVNGYVDGLLKITEPGVAVEVGTNYFVGPGFKFIVDGAPLLALDRDSAGHLQLSLDLYDPADSLLLQIHNNEWLTGDPMPWDIEFSHRLFVLRRKSGEIT
ncbi:MAG: HNH endonuclease signature motif containing protein [Nitrospirales bacterium]